MLQGEAGGGFGSHWVDRSRSGAGSDPAALPLQMLPQRRKKWGRGKAVEWANLLVEAILPKV